MDNRKMKKLNRKELDQIAGGCRRRGADRGLRCRHEHKIRTGNEKEERFFRYWSRHKYEYYCPDCEATFWESN